MSKVELVPSQFSPVPHASPLSYQCPPIAAGVPDVYFPPLPVLGYQFGCNLKFVPTHHQALHLESIKVTHSSACQIEEATRLQSKCTAWGQIQQSRVTASRFREVCHTVGVSASQSLAARIIKGTRQTSAMKCGLELEPDISRKYSETASVSVLPCGFIINPEAPHLGASPDGRVHNPSETFQFGLVEVKSTSADNIAQVPFMKIQRGLAKLKETHKYYWQVQRQLAVTGLHWCDFVSDTKSDCTIKRIWRHDAFIASMKDKLHMYYYNVFMDLYLSVV
uniref:YqaJ viral recombinase domain-containing protein n=1 Tax=Cyprinus carpio carpio TaxID=630221 RepID=A0A9J8CQT6_CYPCA